MRQTVVGFAPSRATIQFNPFHKESQTDLHLAINGMMTTPKLNANPSSSSSSIHNADNCLSLLISWSAESEKHSNHFHWNIMTAAELACLLVRYNEEVEKLPMPSTNTSTSNFDKFSYLLCIEKSTPRKILGQGRGVTFNGVLQAQHSGKLLIS